MKTTEAKEIIRTIIIWQMVLMGVSEREELEGLKNLSEYSLEELIQANKLVKANNSRKKKLQQYYQKKYGKANGISQQMTCDDRVIAAIYTALHFTPNGEMVVIIDDVGVGCVKVNYEKGGNNGNN